jgi:predicted dehydrogenase
MSMNESGRVGDRPRVRLAVVGAGGMGRLHVQNAARLADVELVAVCDADRDRAVRAAEGTGAGVWTDHLELFENERLDAVLIATPHYFHTSIASAAFGKGLSVLCEKPLAVHVNDGRKMLAAYEAAKAKNPGTVFALMFNQRTNGEWIKVKDLIDSGELGKLVRTTWIITDWFRTQYYYDTGGWRATWKGEGGGVLLNQCPHNLDLYQWFVGMPSRVTAFASLGKYHRIEVEDEVTAFLEHPDGMTGQFVTSTAESPGTNRLEIVGEHGKLVYEHGELTFFRNRRSMFDALAHDEKAFTKVECWEIPVPIPESGGAHLGVLENFARAVLTGAPLIAPGVEGIRSLELGNAMLLSALTRRTVELPLDGGEYESMLTGLIERSVFRKTDRTGEVSADEMKTSF